MAIINILTNTASVEFDGQLVNSNPVSTSLALAPTIIKTVDKIVAKVGDLLIYTVVVTNISLVGIDKLPFTDLLPEGVVYVDGTFMLDGIVVEPTIVENTLNYVIIKLLPAGIATITFQVKVVG